MTGPPKGSDGSSTGSEPVAITTVSARMTCVPVSVSTSTVLPSRNVARPWTILTLALLQQAEHAAVQPADDAVLPGDRLGEIELGRLDADAERAFRAGHMTDLLEFLGRMDQRLGRDAADVEAGAAGLAASTMTVSTPSCPARMAQI